MAVDLAEELSRSGLVSHILAICDLRRVMRVADAMHSSERGQRSALPRSLLKISLGRTTFMPQIIQSKFHDP